MLKKQQHTTINGSDSTQLEYYFYCFTQNSLTQASNTQLLHPDKAGN